MSQKKVNSNCICCNGFDDISQILSQSQSFKWKQHQKKTYSYAYGYNQQQFQKNEGNLMASCQTVWKDQIENQTNFDRTENNINLQIKEERQNHHHQDTNYSSIQFKNIRDQYYEHQKKRSTCFEKSVFLDKEQIYRVLRKVIQEVQNIFNQNKFEFQEAKFTLLNLVKNYIIVIEEGFPCPMNLIGQLLLGNGNFHYCWVKIHMMSQHFRQTNYCQKYYKFAKSFIKINMESFDEHFKTLNQKMSEKDTWKQNKIVKKEKVQFTQNIIVCKEFSDNTMICNQDIFKCKTQKGHVAQQKNKIKNKIKAIKNISSDQRHLQQREKFWSIQDQKKIFKANLIKSYQSAASLLQLQPNTQLSFESLNCNENDNIKMQDKQQSQTKDTTNLTKVKSNKEQSLASQTIPAEIALKVDFFSDSSIHSDSTINSAVCKQQQQQIAIQTEFKSVYLQQISERRKAIETAAMIFDCDEFYSLEDIQIIEVQECTKSVKREIAVMKAYVKQRNSAQNSTKIQKRKRKRIKNKTRQELLEKKTLVCAYKFSSSIELLRIVEKYGVIHGIVVYPSSLNIQNYLIKTIMQEKYYAA